MLRLFLAAVLAILVGCSGSRYTEGTYTAIGAYIPVDTSLYGVEIVQYLNGCSVRTGTNQAFSVRRDYCATNTYLWGMAETRESVRTQIDVSR